MESNIKAYFVADVHLGARFLPNNYLREKKFVSWLDMVAKDASHIFLLGDIFDYWFEYNEVVPKGFVRTLGKLAELCDKDIKVHFFAGNHDRWSFGYLNKEIGLNFHENELSASLAEKKFFLHHGDGLGNFDVKYNLLKKMFQNKFIQWLYKGLPPNWNFWFAHKWSASSRLGSKNNKTKKVLDIKNEFQIRFAEDVIKTTNYDYFIFGHRHFPYDVTIGKKTRVIGLGDWVYHFDYAVFDGKNLTVKTFS